MPFSLCDLEGFPTDQPATAEPRKNVTSLLQRLGAPASPLRNATPAVTFISGALYFVEVPPHALPASPEHTPTPTPATPNPDPDPNQAYAAALTYDLVYEREIPKRREQFTVPIYTRVTAVPVAARSVRGRLPSGARCDNASLAANSSGAVLVELGREASQWRK